MNLKNTLLQQTIEKRLKILLPLHDIDTLRRAQMRLHRWAELECGDADNYSSWYITRDKNGKTWKEVQHVRCSQSSYRVPYPDYESGALKRIQTVCAAHNLYYYHQTDPRGCALYISTEPLTDINYTNGVACVP